MKKTAAVFLAWTLLSFGVAADRPAEPVRPELLDFSRHLQYLSSDQMRGRGNDDPELDVAAGYIADAFKQYGLIPAGRNGTYYQEFEAKTSVRLKSPVRLTLHLNGRTHDLVFGTDFAVLGYSSPIDFSASVVFAGFGVTAQEVGYDDYAGTTATDKIVAIFQHEPQEADRDSAFNGARPTPYSTLPYKIANAKAHGARALLLLTDPYCPRDRSWGPETAMAATGLPVLKLSESWSRRIAALAAKDNAGAARNARRARRTPVSGELSAEARIGLTAEEQHRILKNVVAVIPGKTSETIVIGAHYDHLGLGERGTTAPETVGQIHNGADDNASGTAGLLHLAKRLSRRPLDRTILFIAFAGEELGLLGSRHYVGSPVVPLDKTRAMINMDMIGRSQGEIMIGGLGTAEEFRPTLEKLRPQSGLVLRFADTPQAASDHLAFVGERIPVLFFFSGLHSDYHRPSDDWERIDLHKTGLVLKLIESTVTSIARSDFSISFLQTDSKRALLDGAVGPDLTTMGLITDFDWVSDGVRIIEAREGTIAASASLAPGDIIVGYTGGAVWNRLDLIDALRGSTAGNGWLDVIRGNQLLRLPLDLSDSDDLRTN